MHVVSENACMPDASKFFWRRGPGGSITRVPGDGRVQDPPWFTGALEVAEAGRDPRRAPARGPHRVSSGQARASGSVHGGSRGAWHGGFSHDGGAAASRSQDAGRERTRASRSSAPPLARAARLLSVLQRPCGGACRGTSGCRPRRGARPAARGCRDRTPRPRC